MEVQSKLNPQIKENTLHARLAHKHNEKVYSNCVSSVSVVVTNMFIHLAAQIHAHTHARIILLLYECT